MYLQEDLGEHVVQGDTHPGYVGTACLLSSFFLESGTDNGLVTLPIMSRNCRQTIGKVRGKPPPPKCPQKCYYFFKVIYTVAYFTQC